MTTEPRQLGLAEALISLAKVQERRAYSTKQLRSACELISQSIRAELRVGDEVTVDGVLYIAANLKAATGSGYIDYLGVVTPGGDLLSLGAPRVITGSAGNPELAGPVHRPATDAERLRFLEHCERVAGAFRAHSDELEKSFTRAVERVTQLAIR